MTESGLGKLNIAVLGTRGIPGRYGGFETFAEELSTRLVKRGHSVTVFGRRRFFERSKDEEFQGVRVRYLPTILHKYLETPIHSLTSFLSLLVCGPRYDAVILCNAANSPFAILGRIKGYRIAINVDGIERNRSKWNWLGRVWYTIGERASVWFGNRVIADADCIAEYYRKRYGIEPTVIRYGADKEEISSTETLGKFGLTAGRYILYVSRLEPENNALGVVEAYGKVWTDMPLVVVGDAPYAAKYIAKVKAAADGRVIFTGFQFGDAYKELRSNCYAYIQATEVGGTHPALVEAMAYGNCIIANDVPEHREVLLDCGLYYAKNNFEDLANALWQVVESKPERDRFAAMAESRARDLYSWDRVVDDYEALFRQLKQA